MQAIRRQLTLFISNGNEAIEKIRETSNPVQFSLIAAHVTLCREDEIGPLKKVIENIKSILLDKPIRIRFGPVERFSEGNGVFIPATAPSNEFNELRRMVLEGIVEFSVNPRQHITLIHPRNALCTDKIFDQIKECELPAELHFDTISLIEQRNGERWTIIEQFPLTTR